MYQIEVLYNGVWHFFEAEESQFCALLIARDIRKSEKLPARVSKMDANLEVAFKATSDRATEIALRSAS